MSAANQSVVYILDASSIRQAIACTPVTWAGVPNVNMQAMMPVPWNYTPVSISGVTVIKNTSGVIGAIINNDPGNAQNFEIQVFDNATTNSGSKIMDVPSLPVNGQKNWPPGGIQLSNGITIYCGGTPTAGGGLLVLWL